MRLFFLQLYDYLVIYFQSPDWQRSYLTIQIISFTISVFLIVGIVYLLSKHEGWFKLKGFLKTRVIVVPPQKAFRRKWGEILARLKSQDEANLKLAVIEADKLFDDFLQKIGYHGETMADKLKQINPAQISNLREVWQAHQIRNAIVHDTDFKISNNQAEFAIDAYQKTFEEFEVL